MTKQKKNGIPNQLGFTLFWSKKKKIYIYDKNKKEQRQMDMFISTDKKQINVGNKSCTMFGWLDKLKLTVSKQCMITLSSQDSSQLWKLRTTIGHFTADISGHTRGNKNQMEAELNRSHTYFSLEQIFSFLQFH